MLQKQSLPKREGLCRPADSMARVDCYWQVAKDHFDTFLEKASKIEQLKTLQLKLNSSLHSTEGDGNLYSVKSRSNVFKARCKLLSFGPAPYLIRPTQTLGPKSPGDLKLFSCLGSARLDIQHVVGQLTPIWNIKKTFQVLWHSSKALSSYTHLLKHICHGIRPYTIA